MLIDAHGTGGPPVHRRIKGQPPQDPSLSEWNIPGLENCFKQLAAEKNIKPGDLQLPLRIMLVGGKYGPPVFAIAELLGKDETIRRINNAIVVIEG